MKVFAFLFSVLAGAAADFRVKFDIVPNPATDEVESFTVLVHEDWAPIGAARFKELVLAGFYDGVGLLPSLTRRRALTYRARAHPGSAQTSASSA